MTAITITLDPAALLDAAAERIRPVGAWAQKASARNKAGESRDPLDPEACSWCATGALYFEVHAALLENVSPRSRTRAAGEAYSALARLLSDADLPSTEAMIKANDLLGFTQRQMCDLLTDTAKALRERKATLTLRAAGRPA